MDVIRWSEEKDHWLRSQRGISFQEISAQILGDDLLDVLESPSRENQQVFIVRCRDYTWVVPFVLEHDNTIFLKTAYPSRKMHRRYGGPHGEEN
jgi:uncharacterized DUF497 family protein